MKQLLLCLLLLLAACSRNNPLTCVELRDNPALNLRAERVPPIEMTGWVSTHYEIASENIRLVDPAPNQTWINGTEREIYHQVRLVDEDVESINLTFTPRPISGQAVIDFLGEPDFYRAYVQQDVALLLGYSFLYLESGIEISGALIVGDRDPALLIEPNIVFNTAEIQAPDTLPALREWKSWNLWEGWNGIQLDRESP